MNTTLTLVFIIAVTAATSLFASNQAIVTHEAFAAKVVNPPTIIIIHHSSNISIPCPLGTISETTTTSTVCLLIPGHG